MREGERIFIRADANAEIGVGHVMRMIALSHAWQDLGGNVSFGSANLLPAMADRLRAESIEVTSISSIAGSEEDARETLALAEESSCAALVIDGYQFQQDYQNIIFEFTGKSLTVDDYGHLERYRTDFVLNQNIGANSALYENRESHTRLLLGSEFALIRREFLACEGRYRQRDGSAKTILVTLGGSDPQNVTLTVVQGLMSLAENNQQFRVITGPMNPRREELLRLTDTDTRFEILGSVSDMSSQYAWGDFAVAAGGSSNWEMCLFGVPRLGIVLAENQSMVIDQLVASGAIISLGKSEVLTSEVVRSQLESVMRIPEKLAQLSSSGRNLVDGRGASRVVEIMTTSSHERHYQKPSTSGTVGTVLVLRDAREDDWRILLRWRNDETTRLASRNPEIIDESSHRQWLSDCIHSKATRIQIAELEGQPVGTIRIDEGSFTELSWTVAPEARGKGIGKKMVALVASIAPTPIRAVIKGDNTSSQKIAANAGFAPESIDGDWHTYVKTTSGSKGDL